MAGYLCTGTTLTGAPCRNRVAEPGGRCGRCLGDRHRPASNTTSTSVAAASVDDSPERVDLSGRTYMSGEIPVLVNADHSGSDMRYADFPPGERCFASSFDGVDLRGNYAPVTFQGCTFREMDGRRAHLGFAFESDFAGANLEGSTLRGADTSSFRATSMRRSVSGRASFMDCDFTGADLDQATWNGCDLSGADLSGAENLDSARLHGCYYDDRTRFPAGYVPQGPAWRARPGPINTVDRDRMRAAAHSGTFTAAGVTDL